MRIQRGIKVMSDEDRIQAAVESYCNKYAIIPRFVISEFCEINASRQKKRNDPWPHGDDAGCYVMYSAERKLLYIGLAGHIASRLNSWFRYNMRESHESPWTSVAKGNWNEQPKYLQTIKANIAYEAPSLEAFLIGVLNPSENINLKNVPDCANSANDRSAFISFDWIGLGRRFDDVAASFDQSIQTKEGPSQETLDKMSAVEKQILEARATTLEGLRVKARAASWSFLGDWNPADGTSTGERMALSIVLDLMQTHDANLLRPGATARLSASVEQPDD